MPTPADRPFIIVYGTSLSAERAAFWRTASGQWVTALRTWLQARYPQGATLLNASRWGATSTWARANLERRVIDHHPDCVMLEFAINDADERRNVSLGTARQNLDEMVARIRARLPACRVILLTTHHCVGRYAERRPELARYYSLYRECAAELGLGLIDLEPLWARWLNLHPYQLEQYLPDGLHPSFLANRELLFPVIRWQLESQCLAGD